MKIELTTDQQQQLDRAGEHPLGVSDPRNHTEYVLVPADQYEQMLEVIEDDLEQRALRRCSNASYRLGDTCLWSPQALGS